MFYIIDGNNLAGKIGLLGQVDFDKMLASRLRDFFGLKRHKVILVFDSNDFMGDRSAEGNIEIIYTPRDGFYKNADDKVLEVVINFLADEDFKEEVCVVTDDLDLQEKVRLAIAYHAKKRRVKIEQSTDFAARMKAAADFEAQKGLSDKSPAEEESSDLNAELLRIWNQDHKNKDK